MTNGPTNQPTNGQGVSRSRISVDPRTQFLFFICIVLMRVIDIPIIFLFAVKDFVSHQPFLEKER